jgi:hypothetical protein
MRAVRGATCIEHAAKANLSLSPSSYSFSVLGFESKTPILLSSGHPALFAQHSPFGLESPLSVHTPFPALSPQCKFSSD